MQQTSEDLRLRALAAYRLIDGAGTLLSSSERGDDLDATTGAEIDAVTRLAATVTGLPIAALNLFDATRQVQLSAVGVPPSISPRVDSPCASHFLDGELVHCANASEDVRFAANPYVDGTLAALRAYASAPLVTPDGFALGTLCVGDVESRELTEQQLTALADLSHLVIGLFERRRQARISAELAATAEEARDLAELLMADAAHRSQLVEAVFAGVGVGIVVTDPQGALAATNATAEAWLGYAYAPDMPITEHVQAFDVRAADGITPMTTADLPAKRALEEGPVDDIEMVLVTPQGHERPIMCSARPLLDPEGTVTGVVVAMHDVTALRAREAALQEAHEQLGRHAEQAAAVARAAHSVTVSDDPQRAICDAARELTGADAVLLMQPSGDRLVIAASSGASRDAEPTVPLGGFELGQGSPTSSRSSSSSSEDQSLTATAFATGEFLFVPEVNADPRHNRALSGSFEVVSGAWQPIAVQEGRSIGVLVVIWQHRVEEVSVAVQAMLSTLAGAAAHTIQRAALTEELARAADHDALTGLANRRSWDRAATREIARAGREGSPLTFLLIDLDHFKKYNDGHGHLAGDQLLRGFAAAAADALREVDLIARWGGEEFAVALPGCDAKDAVMIADRIRARVPDGQTATIGIAQWSPGASADQVLSQADAALYRGKQGGRNTTVVQVVAAELTAATP